MNKTHQAVTRSEHDQTQQAKRVLLVDAFGGVVTDNGNLTTKIDEASATITYIGKAQLGTAVDATDWQIKRIEVSGTVTTIAYADSTDDFIKVWEDRATYTYI